MKLRFFFFKSLLVLQIKFSASDKLVGKCQKKIAIKLNGSLRSCVFSAAFPPKVILFQFSLLWQTPPTSTVAKDIYIWRASSCINSAKRWQGKELWLSSLGTLMQIMSKLQPLSAFCSIKEGEGSPSGRSSIWRSCKSSIHSQNHIRLGFRRLSYLHSDLARGGQQWLKRQLNYCGCRG